MLTENIMTSNRKVVVISATLENISHFYSNLASDGSCCFLFRQHGGQFLGEDSENAKNSSTGPEELVSCKLLTVFVKLSRLMGRLPDRRT